MNLKKTLILILLVAFASTAKAEVGISDPLAPVYQAFILHTVDPYNEEKLDNFLALVSENKSSLESSDQGKHLIGRAKHARRAFAIKKKLDSCFEDSDDIRTLAQANTVLQEAMKLNGYAGHCNISESEISDMTSFFSDFNSYIRREENQQYVGTTQDLRRELFVDTSLKSSISEASLRHLIREESEVPSLLSTMCGENNVNCSPDFVERFQQLAQLRREELINEGHNPLPAAEVAQNLERDRIELYGSVLNNEEAPYHLAQRDPELYRRLKERHGSGLDIASIPAYSRDIAFMPSPVQVGDQAFRETRVRDPQAAQEQFQTAASRTVLQAELAIPEAFYEKQRSMQNNPYAAAMATDARWAHSLGFSVKPEVHHGTIGTYITTAGAVIDFRSTGFGDEGRGVDLSRQKDLITEENILRNRENALKNLNDTIGEMGQRIFVPDPEEEQEDVVEDLSKLMVANPRAAAQALMNNPTLLKHYCDVFNDIKSDEDFNKWVGWGLLGLGVGLVVLTGGMAAIAGAGGLTIGGTTLVSAGVASTVSTIGSGALAISLMADITFLSSNALSDLEIGQLQRAVCVSEGVDSEPCRQFQNSLNSATSNFLLAGVSGASGVGVFIKMISGTARTVAALGRIARNTEKITELIRQNGSLRSLFARLSQEESAALYGRLATLSDEELASFIERMNSLNADEMGIFIQKLRESLSGRNPERINIFSLLDESRTTVAPSRPPIQYTSSADEAHPTFDMQRLWRLQETDPTAALQLERQIMETMAENPYRVVRQLGGANGGATLVEFENGVRAVMKSGNFTDMTGPAIGFQINMELERAAFLIDRRIGLNNVPPTILRNIDGEVRAFQFFAAGAEVGTGNANNLRLFDYLMGNTDRVSSGVRNSGNIINLNGRAVAIDNALHLRSHNDVLSGIPEFSHSLLSRAERTLESAEAALARAQGRAVRLPGQIERLTAEVNIARGRVVAQREEFLSGVRRVMWDRETYQKFKNIREDEWRQILSPPSGAFREETEMINFLHHRRDMIRYIDEMRLKFGDDIFPQT